MRFVAAAVRVTVLLAGMLLACSIGAATRADEPVKWLTGAALREKLDPASKANVTWSGDPFRTALLRFARDQQVAILLDRRVDPDQMIELSTNLEQIDVLLRRIAEKARLGAGWGWAGLLSGARKDGPADSNAGGPAAGRRRPLAARRDDFTKKQPWHWDIACTTEDIVAELSKQSHIKIDAADRIPYDVWNGADLPALSFIERLTLLAAQFELTFQIAADGQSVKLVDIPAKVELRRAYALTGPKGLQKGEIVSKLKENLPDAKISLESGKLVVRGRAEDQDFAQALLSGAPARRVTTGPAKEVHTLTIEMRVGQLIRGLAKKLNTEVEIDEAAIAAAGLSLDTPVKVSVEKVSTDELWHAVLTPAGLTFEHKGEKLVIVPANKAAAK